MNKLITLLPALLAAVLAEPALALSHPDIDFGMVGIARGQTARLNVVNTSEMAHHSCRLALLFFDSSGQRIVRWDQFAVEAGHSMHLDLNSEALGLAPGQRAQIRGRVSFGPGASDYTCRFILATEEIYNNDTGQTQILNPPVAKGTQFVEPAFR